MKKKDIVQVHHISYAPEETVRVYKGEHWILTQLCRRKKISAGFICALYKWLAENGYRAKEI
jgi:hypothetical protein